MTPHDPPALIVADANAWRQWPIDNDDRSDGVWLTLAQKHTTAPTSLTYNDTNV